MAIDFNDIPNWLREWPRGLKLSESTLKESREEMYSALSLFHNHVKYVISVLLALPAAILLLMRFAPSGMPPGFLYLLGGVILVLAKPVSKRSIKIMQMYYQVYVSALVFATRVHIAAGGADIHPWLERTIGQAKDRESKVTSAQDFITARVASPDDTYTFYTGIATMLATLSMACGLAFLGLALYVWSNPPLAPSAT